MHYNASGRNPGIDLPFAFMMVAQEPVDEAGGHVEGRLRRVTMRGMARARQDRYIDRAIALLLRRLRSA